MRDENVVSIKKTTLYILEDSFRSVICEIYLLQSAETSFSLYVKSEGTRHKIISSTDLDKCLFQAKMTKIRLLNRSYLLKYKSPIIKW